MNTTHTTFSSALPSYTVVGGKERRASTGLSAVILYRGKHGSPLALFEELDRAGFDYVVSIEGSGQYHDLEALASSFPFARFILLKDRLNPGEQINLAASELSSPLFFVLWNDLRIIRAGGAGRMAERLLAGAEETAKTQEGRNARARLCTVPVIQNGRFETMATIASPAMIEGSFVSMPSVPSREGEHSIYPFDGAGIYNRESFIRLGGFDAAIENYHWQLLDFGFRSFLWGEEITATLAVKLAYEGAVPEEDSSPGASSRRFFLKNLAPVFRGDYANIPLRSFPRFFRRSGEDLFSAWGEFAEGRRWVNANCRSFRSDAKLLMEGWKRPEEGALT